MTRTYAFVTGVPRSGTSVLASMLTRHPDVAIMHERFYRAVEKEGFGPHLFESDRVKTYDETDGIKRAYEHPTTQAALSKWESARVVGDKIPNVEAILKLPKVFKGAKIIAIVRDPYSVAMSYHRRSHSVEDPWPAWRNHEKAMAEFNASMRALSEAKKNRGIDLLIVDYNEIFAEQADLSPMFDFLGVDAETGRKAAAGLQAKSADERRNQSRVATHVSMNGVFEDYRDLLNSARQTWSGH